MYWVVLLCGVGVGTELGFEAHSAGFDAINAVMLGGVVLMVFALAAALGTKES